MEVSIKYENFFRNLVAKNEDVLTIKDLKGSLSTGAKVIKKEVVRSLKEKVRVTGRSKFSIKRGKKITEGVRVSSKGYQNSVVVHIMGDPRLRWLEKGTGDRNRDKEKDYRPEKPKRLFISGSKFGTIVASNKNNAYISSVNNSFLYKERRPNILKPRGFFEDVANNPIVIEKAYDAIINNLIKKITSKIV